MKIETHIIQNTKVAEVVSDEIIIQTTGDGLDLLGNMYYQDFDKIIIHQENITPAFFELKSGMAGEILQKFSNYRVRLAIVGDFSQYTSKSFQDFIFESNKTGHIIFATSIEDALKSLALLNHNN
jgi:hypothetical protein